MPRNCGFISAAATLFCLALVELAQAGGYAIPPQTAEAQAMGGAATAGVDDPSAVYVNPAALGQIKGNQLMAGITYINTISSVRNSSLRSKNFHDDDFVPNFFANYHVPNSKVTLGIGSYAPFGLATSYNPDSFTRYAAIRSELKTLFVTPSIAWEPLPYLSLGGGVSFVHASSLLSRAIFFGPFGDGKIRITDTSDSYGYNFGVLVKPTDYLKFGLTYRSKVNLNFDSANVSFSDAAGVGGAATRARASGINVPLPLIISFGANWRIHPQWEVEFQYDYARWSQFEHLKAKFSGPLPGLLGGFPIGGFLLPQDWKNASTLRFGVSHKLTPALDARFGFALEETPIPAKSLGPVIPGADYLSLTAGVGYRWMNLKLDAGYMAVFYKTRSVSNNVLETGGDPTALPFPGVPGKDKYKIFQNLVGLHATYEF